MSEFDKQRWTDKYAAKTALTTIEPDTWLKESLTSMNVLARQRALVLACGQGNNAIWLAQQGWQVDAIDISPTGLDLARQAAALHQLDVRWIEADLDNWVPSVKSYELAIVFRFLDRISVPRIIGEAVRQGGWLVYETFSSAQFQRSDNHLQNKAYALEPGELPEMFPDFTVIAEQRAVLDDRTIDRFFGRREA